MTEQTLIRANAIKKTIDKLECEHSKISKLYSKKEDLTKEEPIRKIDTCYNFDMKIGCVQDICRCEQEVYDRAYQPISLSEVDKEEPKQESVFSQLYVGKDYKQEVFELGEESKQETFEEAAKDFIENTMKYSFNSLETKTFANRLLKSVEFGTKWQAERMYSEEEVHKIIGSYNAHLTAFGVDFTYNKWFEQFKKK
jgi:hypothetical protein